MQYTVFFSWQSDLTKDNTNFIESCLLKSIGDLKKDINYDLEINIDRDTKSEIGTPDITGCIFDKIDRCSLFVADVSIINSESKKYKKTPNPNVLIELGYAAKKLGWDRIICVFNNEYGKPEDLPFDIKCRFVLAYSLSERKKVEDTFYNALLKNYENTIFTNELLDYYNSDIYSYLFKIIVDFAKILFGYDNNNSSLETIKKVLGMTETEIKNSLDNSSFIGFQLFKDYNEDRVKLADQLEKIVSLKYFDDEYYVPLVRLIKILRFFNKELNRRTNLSNFHTSHKINSNFKVLSDNSSNNSSGKMLLLRETGENQGIVTDFGCICRKDLIPHLTEEFTLTSVSLNIYKNFIVSSLKEINTWVDNNDGEFIIDASRMEIYPKR